jgi:hypothetical protein
MATTIAQPAVPVRAAPVWTRLDLVENSAEGPAFDRCQIEATLEKSQTAHWRVFFGEVRADADTAWSAIRPASGCAQGGTDAATAAWTLRGSPYFLVDVAVGKVGVSGRDVVIEAALSVKKLTGFAPGGAPEYELRTEARSLRVPDGGSAVVPILIAGPRETDELGVRELLLKFRASAVGSRPKVEYGEIAVAADIPRAEILLDGGFVGRTSADGPLVLGAVRVGEREVIVHDASGREARVVVRVEKGRRTTVSPALMKNFPPSADGLRPMGLNPQGGSELWRKTEPSWFGSRAESFRWAARTPKAILRSIRGTRSASGASWSTRRK